MNPGPEDRTMDRKRLPVKLNKAQLVPGLDSEVNFTTGRLLLNKTHRNKHMDVKHRLRTRPDVNATLPVRQTASIFKQPVSKVTNHPNNKVKTDLQRDVDQPKQLFWNRKLNGLSAFDASEESLQTVNLPQVLHSVAPSCSDRTLLLAIASPAPSGQLTSTGGFRVTDDDIRKQEDLVQSVRRRLEAALMVHMLAHVEKTTSSDKLQVENT